MIRYVCLSDLHLGEEDSILTNVTNNGKDVDTTSPSPVLARLAECLARLVESTGQGGRKPSLVLNGDLLELALADMDKAAIVFAQFLSLVMPEDGELFDEIIFIPGNHDHHLWEMARETQYLNYMRRLKQFPDLKPPWHTTKVFMDLQDIDRLANRFLTEIVSRFEHLQKRRLEVLTAYPNFGVLNGSGRRSVVFHHGHFIEPLYHAMSTATSLVFPNQKLPGNVYELEAENFAWIDFFWSSMGRSGKAGEDVESIYEATNSRKSLSRITDSLAQGIAKRYNLPFLWPDCLEEAVLRTAFRLFVVNRVAGKQERQQGTGGENALPLSEAGLAGLRWYVEGPLRRQVEVEHGPLPESVTLILGHTHKPFEQLMSFQGYSNAVKVLNTGGWVVDTVERDPPHGAAIALVDEELNAVNIRAYNEDTYEVRVKEPSPPGTPRSHFCEHINRLVNASAPVWRNLAEAIQREVAARARFLAERIERRNPGSPA